MITDPVGPFRVDGRTLELSRAQRKLVRSLYRAVRTSKHGMFDARASARGPAARLATDFAAKAARKAARR